MTTRPRTTAKTIKGIKPLPWLVLAWSLTVEARDIDYIDIDLDDIRERLGERVTTRIEARVRSQVRARVRHSLEDRVNDAVMDNIVDQVSESVTAATARPDSAVIEFIKPLRSRASVRDTTLRTIEHTDTDRLIESQLERAQSQIQHALSTEQDNSGNAALTDEWLIMTDELTLQELIAQGYVIGSVESLAGLGYVLGTVKAPGSFAPDSLSAVQVVDDPQVIVDLNHVYLPQTRAPGHRSANRVIHQQRSLKSSGDHPKGWTKIGMIDSSIDTGHSVFVHSTINEQAFTPREGGKSLQHGTAIASLLVGQSEQFTGLSPGSHLYNGVVFATDEQGREFSTTAAIVRAINWLATNGVRLINMSLAGPDNGILRQAIKSACNRGIVVVTAAGNAGPASKPLFPAAYDCTLAVTAVDTDGRAYHRANQGNYIDYALPGVDIRHATENDSFSESSGTSFAAAQLTGLIASELPQTALTVEEVKTRLNYRATDIGEAGRDPVYGQGVIGSTRTARLPD